MSSVMRGTMVAVGLIAVTTLGLVACEDASDQPADAGPGIIASDEPHRVALPRGASAYVPSGWTLLRKPITGVIHPVQVLAAASYPVTPVKPSPGCHPGRLLNQRPPGGVLIQVFEYTDHPNLERFPSRERPFRLPGDLYRSDECAGPSYNVFFRDHGRAFQAFVMLDVDRVEPRIRRQANALFTSLRFANPRTERRVRRAVIEGVKRDFRAATEDPPGFADCFLAGFGRELDGNDLRRLVALHRERGDAAAARALNRQAIEVGDACGGRRWVPQLSGAARGLAAG